MQVPPRPRSVSRLRGTPSVDLAEHCPDGRVRFPTEICTNHGCEWRVNEAAYGHCAFLAAAAGAHSHSEIGRMLGISPQAVQWAEKNAIRKLGNLVPIHNLRRNQDLLHVLRESQLAPGPSPRIAAAAAEGSITADEDLRLQAAGG